MFFQIQHRRIILFSKFILYACVLVLFFTSLVQAAQDTTIMLDNAPIYLEPNPKTEILEYIPVGSEVRISNYPLPGGWYKIRSKTGVYGWIHESNLSVQKLKKKEEVKKEEKDFGPKPERDRRWFLRGVAGFDFFSPDDLNDLFQFRELNSGYYFGGELGVLITWRFALAFRSELLTKDVVARERSVNQIYNVSIRSYPIMGGLDFYIVQLPPMRLSLGVFGGMALATTFTSEGVTLSPPNAMVLQGNALTGLARVNLTRPLSRVISVFIEAGYRYLKTPALATSGASSINGGTLFIKDNLYVPRVIDLSGPFAGAGIGIHL